MMRTFYLLALVAGLSAGPSLAWQQWPFGTTILKTRQRQELQALKLKQKYAMKSLDDSRLPAAVRTEFRHELKHEGRRLRQRQKTERETLKDRERLLNLELRELEPE